MDTLQPVRGTAYPTRRAVGNRGTERTVTSRDLLATLAFIAVLLCVAVAVVMFGSPANLPRPTEPLRWDEIPVCLDCGSRAV